MNDERRPRLTVFCGRYTIPSTDANRERVRQESSQLGDQGEWGGY